MIDAAPTTEMKTGSHSLTACLMPLASGSGFGSYCFCSNENRLEQAEVGQSPTLLALRYRYGGFTYPPGILYRVFDYDIKENRILQGILYINISAYPDILKTPKERTKKP